MAMKKQQAKNEKAQEEAESVFRKEKPIPSLASEKLMKWMKDNKLTQNRTAKRLGVDQVSISRYLHGISRPKLPTAVKVERITKGAVQCKDWMMKGRKKYGVRGLAA